MIVPMKKVCLAVQQKDLPATLAALRDAGILHLEHVKPPVSPDITQLREYIDGVERVISVLETQKPRPAQVPLEDWDRKTREILGLQILIDQYKEGTAKRATQITQWEPWGNFDPDAIEELETQGVYIRLVELAESEIDQLPDGVALEPVFKQGNVLRALAVSRKPVDLPFKILALPQVSLDKFKEVQKRNLNRIVRAEERIHDAARYLNSFHDTLNDLKEQLQYQQALLGAGVEGPVSYLTGYCPEEICQDLRQTAAKQQWGLLIEDPKEGDQVPTLLRNPRWIELIKPVFSVIEILPGYREADISIAFLCFFTLFFGILIGDAAYGFLFLAAVVFAQIKWGRILKDTRVFFLGYLLTGVTILWGVLTGTYFGQEWLPDAIQPVLPWLNDAANVQMLCFMIALVHLSIARAWSFALRFPDITCLSAAGWLLILWGMYFLASMFVLGAAFPAFAKWFFIVGIPLAFFFMVPPKEFLKKAPQDTIPFILGTIGAGSDIVSYIRLFAVGLATVAVADAANNMPAAQMPLGLNYFLFIFLHILNMGLALMAILVHAVRLNVLEFAGHMGLEWAGVKYDPFRKGLKQA